LDVGNLQIFTHGEMVKQNRLLRGIFDQRRHCKQDSQQPFNKKSLRKRIVMSTISPDSLVVAVKLGHMLVICRSKSSLCLDLLNEIRVYIHIDECSGHVARDEWLCKTSEMC
jgi:hypothetical protein